MAGFCENCGAPLSGGGFCQACGAKVKTASVPLTTPAANVPPLSATPVYNPPLMAPGPPPQSGGALKIILIVLGILGFFLLAAMGSCVYIAYRAKEKVAEFAHAEGSRSVYSGTKDACSLITAADVGEAIGQPAVQDDSSTSTDCRFHYGSDNSNTLNVQFSWQGGAMALKIARLAMKHGVAGSETMTTLSGVGDEAYIAPMGSTLMMRKGDVLVTIDLRQAGLNAAAGKKIASRIATQLGSRSSDN